MEHKNGEPRKINIFEQQNYIFGYLKKKINIFGHKNSILGQKISFFDYF